MNTCQFLVVEFKACGKPATHFREVTTISSVNGVNHEFTTPREYYCVKHYGYAAKWCTQSDQFRYNMGELTPMEKGKP